MFCVFDHNFKNDSILYDPIYMMFWKKENDKNRKQWCQGIGGGVDCKMEA